MSILQLAYVALAAAGAALAGFGLYLAHKVRRPYDSLAALGSVVGAALFLVGSLLSQIPDFFSR